MFPKVYKGFSFLKSMVKKKVNGTEEMQEVSRKSRMKINYWMIASVVLAVLLLINGIIAMTSGISKATAEKKFVEFAQSQGADVEVVSVEKIGGLYEVTYDFAGQEGKFHISEDGKYIGQMMELEPEKTLTTGQAVSEASKELVKSDKPVVELFVMTHCPYGTQAEKGFIPFMESAIKNKVDAKIRFVHYTMHGEVEDKETLRQVCIREEQSSKYLTYLREFLNEGNSASAGISANVDEAKISQCISNGNAEKYYAEDSELSQQYGVQGSPTLIINGVEASSGRSASAYLQTACSAFNNAPSECNTLQLSSQNPTPMWGWDASSASATTAQC